MRKAVCPENGVFDKMPCPENGDVTKMVCPKSGNFGKGSVHFMGYSLKMVYITHNLAEQSRAEQSRAWVNCALFGDKTAYYIRDG